MTDDDTARYLASKSGREALAFQLAQGMTPTPQRTPAEKLVEILIEELPGFKTAFHAGTNQIRSEGYMKIGNATSAEAVIYPAYDGMVESVAREIVERTRRFVIEAAGLEKLIKEREDFARSRGMEQGRSEGLTQGRQQGRAEAIREFAAAMRAEVLEEDL